MSDPKNTDETAAAEPELTVHGEDGTSSISPNSIEGLFLLALQKQDPAEREAWLDQACGDDQEQRQRVTALLRAYDDAGSFLETPASGPRPLDEVSLSFLKPIDKEGCLGTIGPYEVLEVIGRGGMGLVLRAVDLKLNRIVAVKVLMPELAANPNSRRRFLREAQAAAAVSHPHVVTIHAVEEAANGEQDDPPTPPYLVMECVVGQSLQQKLDIVGPLRLPEIVRISRQIGEGLAAAHRQGLIHRDIKPANILLENGVERVKITDFGLARAIDDITVTRTGEVSGTPQYMSPEQANGERVDHRSDLFSLGCVMYAMCTGHSPFRGDSLAHVIKRVTQDAPRPIIEQNSEIPAWLVQIIDCLLDKSADKRFQSAEGVAVILEQHLARIQQPSDSDSHTLINQQVPIAAVPPAAPVAPAASPVAAPGNRIKVSKWLQSLGRIVILVSVAVVAMMWWGSGTNVGIGPAESGVLFLLGAWPMLMGAFLCRCEMTREALLAVLFLGLGPLGLVIYLFASERLEAADPNDAPPPITRHQVGTWFVAAGALVLFCFLAWFVLVALEVLDASQATRTNAQSIMAVCLGVFAVLMMIGMLLRGEILGHESWTSLFKLSGLSLLGPLGIWYWMSVLQKPSPENALPTAERTSPSRDGEMPGWLLTRIPNPFGWFSIAQRQDESIHARFGCYLFAAAVFFCLCPFLIMVIGILIPDGDLMQFGGPVWTIALPICAVAAVLGYVLRYIVDKNPEQHVPMRLNRIAILAIAVAVFGSAGQQIVEYRTRPIKSSPSPSLAEAEVFWPPSRESVVPAEAPMDTRQPAVVMPVQPAEGERSGTLHVAIDDDGMRLVVRRKSAFGGYVPGSEQQVDNVGFSQLRLHPGDYELGIQDRQFGWDFKFVTTDLTIREGHIEQFHVRRDLSVLPRGSRGGAFRWDGEVIRPTDSFGSWNENHTTAINLLIAASEEGVLTKDLVKQVRQNIEWKKKHHGNNVYPDTVPKSIDDIFDPLPKFIVTGGKEDTLRLAPLPRSTIKVSLPDPGLQMTLKAKDESSDVAVRSLGDFSNTADAEYHLPPGEYEVVVSDRLAHWSHFDDNSFQGKNLTKRRLTVELQLHDQKELTFDRDFKGLAEHDLGAVKLDKRETLKLYWGPAGGFSDGGIDVSLSQAQCLQRLIAALDAGTPDVSEEELQKVTGQPVAEVFPGFPKGSYGRLVIAGKSPGTWRIRDLPTK